MRTAKFTALALILAGCGGGASDTAVSPSPPVAQAPPSEPPAPEPTKIPAPAPKPPADPPDAPQPAPDPAPFVYGYLVKTAIQSTAIGLTAYDVNGTDRADLYSRTVAGNWEFRTQSPTHRCPADYCGPVNQRHFPLAATMVSVGGGDFTMGAEMFWSLADWQERNEPLARDTPFVIRDGDKFTLNTTIAEWRLGADFAQLQVSTLDGEPNVFRLCQHLRLETIKRLACSLHDKDTAVLVGAHILDDSNGPMEYLSP